VATQDVVPEDILELQAGAIVAADARVLTVAGLSVDESAQTGEPVAAAKRAQRGRHRCAARGAQLKWSMRAHRL
jgi:magnesium-transporting ATPase (P-type)